MAILRLITFLSLTILPVTVLFRDWKFHDKRTKKHHNITRAIIVFWFIASIAATLFVWQESSQIEELIEGKNQLLVKVDKYQKELTEKEQEIEELKEKAKNAERGISEYFFTQWNYSKNTWWKYHCIQYINKCFQSDERT